MNISFAITSYKEHDRGNYGWIKECIAAPVKHPLVSEIVITNDSDDEHGLREALAGIPKVRIVQNKLNMGVFGNKVESVAFCTNEWVQMADSDNVMDLAFLDKLESLQLWDASIIYCPSFAKPSFDYREMTGPMVLKDVVDRSRRRNFGSAMNTGNQFVHRPTFMEVFGKFRGPRFDMLLPNYFTPSDRKNITWRQIYDASDSFFINKTWLSMGYSLLFVPGLEYDHRLHHSSWARAPEIKAAMPPVFFLEMIDMHERRPAEYKLLRIQGANYLFNCHRGSVIINSNDFSVRWL